MPRFVVNRPDITVDCGDGQFLIVRKLGVLEYREMLKTQGIKIEPDKIPSPDEAFDTGKNLLLKVVVGWKGFREIDTIKDNQTVQGKEVPFSLEVFKNFVMKLDADELDVIVEAVLEAILPTPEDEKKVEKLNDEVKN